MASFYIGLSLMSNSIQKAVSGRALSAEARRVLALLAGRPLGDSGIAFEENGRPYFPDRREDFSISHSGNMAAVSLVNGRRPRTGCDVQLVKPRTNIREIAGKFFHPSEADYVFAREESQTERTRFFHIWTLKESYLKLKGLSVLDMEKAPSFIEDNAFCCKLPFSFSLYELAGAGETYVLAAAVEEIIDRPLIRWYSQSFLTVSSIAEINAAVSPPVTVSPNM